MGVLEFNYFCAGVLEAFHGARLAQSISRHLQEFAAVCGLPYVFGGDRK